ncbi:hypothetical protein [Portibacter marinus]|uniref:hypothetical protein n=1 Tax=Portibacter marinus TaxID=2898660 RepID=UPI001F2A0318|nr:hypothetical protein [Portibacter marinus]
MRALILFFFMSMFVWSHAQITPGVYFSSNDDVNYELKLTDNYLVLNTYESEPARFLQSIGGYYQLEDDEIKVDLEFNSEYEKDSIRHVDIPYQYEGGILIFRMEPELVFNKMDDKDQELDGAWLFATRGPDEGQDRRGDMNPRKTLKILMDGRFQWIAYNVDDMRFFGTGGGGYVSEDGEYVESIEFFSRDDSRVGAQLPFNYEIKGDDWHHTGLNSKGEPMYEIWSRR